MTGTQLSELVRSGCAPLLLDVRVGEQRAITHLDGDRWIPFDELPTRVGELPRDRAIVVYCHYGGMADRASELLRNTGRAPVAALEGGIDAYARLIDPTLPRYWDDPGNPLILQQFPNRASGCLSYLLRDRSRSEAVIVDPPRDLGPLSQALDAERLHLRAIIETHTHADHLSGHAPLHERTGAPIWVSHRSPAQYPHRSLTEGMTIEFGEAELGVIETPGHTKDHLSLRAAGVVFTGDTLLPGSCGRSDLGDGDPELLWTSLTQKLLRLPDETEVFPAHYGPLQGLPPPERYSSTIGFERRTNEALGQPDLESFLRYMTEGWPPKPSEFDRIVGLNLAH